MANAFKAYTNTGITTEETVLTGAASTQTTVIGLTIANTTTAAITASLKFNNNDGDNVYIVKDAPIPVGGSLIAVGGDQKIVLESSDTMSVIATGTVDVLGSTLEIS